MATPVMHELVNHERERVYVYPGGERVMFRNVTHVGVSQSGTHRLNLADGLKIIVVPGWLYIELDMDDWTF